VRKVIGESLADEMMFLQCSEGVLKDGIVRTSLQTLPQFRKIRRFLTPDSQQVFRRVEVKRLVGLAQALLVSNGHDLY
jgi:hypothetical protein